MGLIYSKKDLDKKIEEIKNDMYIKFYTREAILKEELENQVLSYVCDVCGKRGTLKLPSEYYDRCEKISIDQYRIDRPK